MADEAQNSVRADSTAPTGPALEWVVHPVRRRPWVSVAVSLFVVCVIGLVRFSTDSQAFAVLTAIIMVASLAKFYFPTRYRIDDAGVTVKTTTQTLKKEWSLYRSCYPDKNGILLSPFAEPSRLENFRGLYLMYDKNAEAVAAFCRSHIGIPSPSVTKSADIAGERS
ncbi:MAG: hypothetical protein HY851_04940 [candidate division Zixibacteria bacterium]|nr:hypothetical protein [candidate division Zixibacteria bacterium]